MDGLEIKREIAYQLSMMQAYSISSNGIFHTVRCPYCGDSRNQNHGHFAVRIDMDSANSPLGYNCFKCGVSGFVTRNVLDELGITLPDTQIGFLKVMNGRYAKTNRFVLSRNESFEVPVCNDELAYQKIDYINNRIGTNLTPEQCTKLRIVPNILDFVTINQIRSIEGINYKMLKFLNYNYVGFLSSNKNLLNLRKINDGPGERYIKCKINSNNMDANTFYSIPNAFDIMYSNKMNVHIAEGIFDILSIYANVNNYNKENNFYFAVCGFGYRSVIQAIINMGLNTGIDLHIYADNDKKDISILRMIKKIPGIEHWIDNVIFHRNGFINEKDYGVPKSRISDTSKIIDLY